MTPKLSRTLVAAVAALLCAACADDETIIPTRPDPGPQPGDELLYHENERTDVYPKLNNEIYLNPPPLLLPVAWRGDSLVQFELASTADFGTSTVYLSDPAPWSMASPHRRLEPGRWYWRYRCHAADGSAVGDWHAAIPFEIPADAPDFVTPSIGDFNESLPSGHPRLESYLMPRLDGARATVQSHPEYRSMINRARGALSFDTSDMGVYYADKDGTTALNQAVTYLYQAYYLTTQQQYADKLLEILRAMIMREPTDAELWSAASNFQPTNIAQCWARIYDLCFDRLQAGERAACERFLGAFVDRFIKMHMGRREGQVFETHFWQHNMLVGFQCAFVLYDKAPYREQTLRWLDYCYEIWVTRAPGTGFNRDGVWHNSSSYFDTNIETLHYMPLILSQVTGTSFLAHPWYQAAGKAMVYTWPVGSVSNGFGDGSTDKATPSRVRLAFADFLARHTGDEYAAWYATEGRSLMLTDIELRLERMVNSATYSGSAPEKIEKLIWYRDAGEAVMHSSLDNPGTDLALSFRSSRYGCVNHTYANQNSFNLAYRGRNIFCNTGYYFKYGSRHHLTDSRHTRAHNTILVNGVGQAFANEAYGQIVRGAESDHIVYCLGDASHAYADTSHIDAWVRNIAAAGLTQTPADGFGATPLTRYLRHCVMLGGDIAVIYDEIEASQPVTIDWLLNSPVHFSADMRSYVITSENIDGGFAADCRLFASQPMTGTLTDHFVTPPGTGYADQWHFAARTGASDAQRFLFIVKVRDLPDSPADIDIVDGAVSLGGWTITASLDPDSPASLRITDSAGGASLDYTAGSGATIITDTADGRPAVITATDYITKHTRSTN